MGNRSGVFGVCDYTPSLLVFEKLSEAKIENEIKTYPHWGDSREISCKNPETFREISLKAPE